MDIKGARIVLIGGAGLVGSHIVDLLIQQPVSEIVVVDNLVRGSRNNLTSALRDPRVHLIEGSMLDSQLLQEVLRPGDGVYLLASLWLKECVEVPRQAWNTNVMGSWNVIEACQDRQVARIVYSSSASVYGNALEVPMTEDHPFNNRTTYGATKIACEQMLRAAHQQGGLPYVGLRYMNIYGPRMDYQGAYVSVMMKVLDRLFSGQPPIIHGDGSQTFDFIYVADVARANLLAMQATCCDEFFNIGCGRGTTLNELVSKLCELEGKPFHPHYEPLTSSFVTQRIGSIDKARDLLGFEATTPLPEGLENLLQWRKLAHSHC
ncbi:NAD-dependent epimerase/dehydratase family protein [bacterium]|nr:NAD-dependent epimerase/dehydratase family protein [bacterium]